MTPTAQFTAEELERMRTILAQADSARARESNSFDLNNPPRKPYTHQDWPRLIYHHEMRVYRPVTNVDELQEGLAGGWSLEPFEAQFEAPALSMADQAQVEHLDRLIEEAKRKKKVA